MYKGFTKHCDRIVNHLAIIEAHRFNHIVVQPEHMLIALLKEGEDEACMILDEMLDLVHFQCILESHMGRIEDEQAIEHQGVFLYYNLEIFQKISHRTKEVLLQAINETRALEANALDTFALFLACCEDKGSIAHAIIMRHKVVLEDIRKYYKQYLKKQVSDQDNVPANKMVNSEVPFNSEEDKDKGKIYRLSLRRNNNFGFPNHVPKNITIDHTNRKMHHSVKRTLGQSTQEHAADAYLTDLTDLQGTESMLPIYGREEEISQVFRIMLRKQKNNPILVGESGVGKSAIIEEIARRIVCGEVPISLLDTKILELNLNALTAGTRYRGDFEDRLLSIMQTIAERSKTQKIFLFIDEFHHIIGTGLANGTTMDAAGILKPALARGNLSCIGATTLEEYRKHIEKDKAFQRRLQTVNIPEMSEIDTFHALVNIKESYEKRHFVKFEENALQEIVRLSCDYIFERYLPDKAVDLIDEVGAYFKLKNLQVPQELTQLYKEEKALRKTLNMLNTTSPKQHNTETTTFPQYTDTADGANTSDVLQTLADEIVAESTLSTKSEFPDTAKAIETLKALVNRRKALQDTLIRNAANNIMTITAQHVREVISEITGIPEDRLNGTNSQVLHTLDDNMKKTVIGQPRAVTVLVSAVRRSMIGLRNSHKPIGSFLFLGPTGVGKTHAAKQLALHLFGNEQSLTRFDMSDFAESNSVNRLIGAPPGYVGFEESGLLIKTMRQRPRQILLFDEIEKAHPRIFDIFLQVLEEGILQGQLGEYANFRHSIIIMTSNIGSRELLNKRDFGFTDAQYDSNFANAVVTEELKRQFRPELINRFSNIVVFESLQKQEIQKIIDMMTNTLIDTMKTHNITLTIHPHVKPFLYQHSFDHEYGARSLQHGIQMIENSIADALIEKRIASGDMVHVSVSHTTFVVEKSHVPPLTQKIDQKIDQEIDQQTDQEIPLHPRRQQTSPVFG